MLSTGKLSNPDREESRWLHRLQVVADETLPDRLRIAAIRALQAGMADVNPLRHTRAAALLNQVKRPWETRVYLIKGRTVELPVSIPPVSLADLW